MQCYCMIFKAELLNYQKKYLPSKCFYENRHYPSSDLFHEQYLQSYDYYKKKNYSNKLVEKKGKN